MTKPKTITKHPARNAKTAATAIAAAIAAAIATAIIALCTHKLT